MNLKTRLFRKPFLTLLWSLLVTATALLLLLGVGCTLGATRAQTVRYLFGSGWALAAVGITAGTVLTAMADAQINQRLLQIMVDQIPENQYSTGVGVTAEALAELIERSQLPLGGLLALMGAQIAVFTLALWFQALALSRKKPRKLMGV